MIESYSFGSIKIDGKEYNHDVIVFKDTVTKWWREEGHNVIPEDLKEIPENIMFLVIGNGASGQCQVPEKTRKYFEDKGIDIIVEITIKAVDIFNKIVDQGGTVVGAFHLTC